MNRQQAPLLQKIGELLYRSMAYKEKRGQSENQQFATFKYRRALVMQAYRYSMRVRNLKLRQKLRKILTYIHTENIKGVIGIVNNNGRRNNRYRNNNNNNNNYY
jgi:hypothetical protein